MAQGGQGKEGTGRDSRWPGRVGRDSERGVMGGLEQACQGYIKVESAMQGGAKVESGQRNIHRWPRCVWLRHCPLRG